MPRIQPGIRIVGVTNCNSPQLEVEIDKLGSGYNAEPQVTTSTVDPQESDLMEQARKFVELPDHAPSRLTAQMQPLLIDPATDKPAPLNTNALPRYLAFVRAANFCPMSQRFLPKLVKFCDEMKAKHPDFEVIYLSCHQTLPDMETFAKAVGFSWPTLTYKQTSCVYILRPHFQILMPQFTVMDLRGNVLISGMGEAENGVVKGSSTNGKDGHQPVLNGISAAAALEKFGALLNQQPASL